jgi:hypothetical protein
MIDTFELGVVHDLLLAALATATNCAVGDVLACSDPTGAGAKAE